jgi:hypothetical protein
MPNYLQTLTGAADSRAVAQSNFDKIDESLAFMQKATKVNGIANTLNGPPTTGTYVLHGLWVDQNGGIWRCTVAGTPGTWVMITPAFLAAFPTGTIATGYRVRRTDENHKEYYYDGAVWKATSVLSDAALTAGRVPSVGANGNLIDDANLLWDNTNKRLGIGGTPAAQFHNFGTAVVADAYRFYTGSADGNTNYTDFRTNPATGNGILSAKSGAIFINYDHGTNGLIICAGTSNSIAGIDVTGHYYLNSGAQIKFSSQLSNGAAHLSSVDAGIFRDAAGILKITDGSTGLGSLKAKALQLQAGASAGTIVKAGGVLFDHYADANNVGAGETDLHSYPVPGSTLNAIAEKIRAIYGGLFAATANNKTLKVYFAGIVIFDSGALAITTLQDWEIHVFIIRTGADTARALVSITSSSSLIPGSANETDLTGITFTNANTLKVTGTGGADNDVTAKLAFGEWLAAA